MKKLINKISVIVLVTTAFTFTNCESLDQLPPQNLSVNTAFNTLKDTEYWRNGFYDILRSNTYGEFYQTSDVQSDLLNVTLAQTPLTPLFIIGVFFRIIQTFQTFGFNAIM